MVPKYSKRYEDANLSLSNNMDDCYRTLSSHVKQNKNIELYSTGGGFKFKDVRNSRNKGVSTSSTTKRSSLSKSYIYRNRIKKEHKSLFGSYVESELRKLRQSGQNTPNLPNLIISNGSSLL